MDEKEQLVVDNAEILTIHVILAAFAVFLSFKCQNGFNLAHVGIALLLPYLYIPYALLVSCPNPNLLPSILR